MPFLMLGLDLPEPPLFKDVMEKNIIPQVFYVLCGVHFSSVYGHGGKVLKRTLLASFNEGGSLHDSNCEQICS